MHRLFKCLYVAVLFTVLSGHVFAQTPSHYYVEIKTSKGNGVLKLYNETPQHRDNFIKLVKEGYYDSLLFHRVINHFMIQGGDPGSKYAVANQQIGSGGPDYKVPAEILEGLIHKKGTIGAARDNNPEKASSGSQFYLVQGRVFSDAALDSLEEFRLKKKLTPLQREIYTTTGGTPHLDGAYTVFGELIDGVGLIDQIAAVKTDGNDRPVVDERMYIRPLSRTEALQLELGEVPKRSVFKKLFSKKASEDYILDK